MQRLYSGLQPTCLPGPGLWRWHALPPILLWTPRSSQRQNGLSWEAPDSAWAKGSLSRDRRTLLGVQRQDLSEDKESAYLVPNQALQHWRQLIQLWSGEIQDWQLPQLRQLLWLVQDNQQPVLLRFQQTGLNQQAW